MYKPISKEERKQYIKERAGTLLFIMIFIFLSMLFMLIFVKEIPKIMYMYLFGIALPIMILITIFRLFIPVNVFSKKLQITNGFIDERREVSNDGSRTLYARARTNDRSKVTKWKYIPFYMRNGQIPVKIIIYKNKAYDFMLTEESYNYVNEVNERMPKKEENKIVQIIIIVIIFTTIWCFTFYFIIFHINTPQFHK